MSRAAAPAAVPPPRATLGMWVFLATELMFFGPLLFGYTLARMAHPESFALASRQTELWVGGVNTAILLISSTAVACAVDAVEAGRRRAGQRLLLGAACLGLLFVGLKTLEYWLDIRKGLLPGTAAMGDGGQGLFFLLYYVMTGVHALHLLAGIVVLLVFSAGLARGTAALCEASHLRVAGLYWHFVDAIWVLLYPILYLVGRSA